MQVSYSTVVEYWLALLLILDWQWRRRDGMVVALVVYFLRRYIYGILRLQSTIKILKIGTPKIITVIFLQMEQLDFTVQ